MREVITKKAKPDTPEQSKAAFTITSSSVIESPFARDKRNKLNSENDISPSKKPPKRSLFEEENLDAEPTCIVSLTETCSPHDDTLSDSQQVNVCTVCGTSEAVLPFPVCTKGTTENINWFKTMALASFFRVKAKSLQTLYICQKDKKSFYDYYDYYVKEIEAKVDLYQYKPGVVSTSDQEIQMNSNVKKSTNPNDNSLYLGVSQLTQKLTNMAAESRHISKVKCLINDVDLSES